MKDIVKVCLAMHERYQGFVGALLPPLMTRLRSSSSSGPSSKGDPDDPSSGGSAAQLPKRICLRLITEFVLHDIIAYPKPLTRIVSEVSGAPSDRDGGGEYSVTDAGLVVTFARMGGNEILSTIPRSVRLETERLRKEIDGKGEGRPRSMMPDLKELEEGTAAGDGSSDAKSTTAGAADASSTPPLFIPTLSDTGVERAEATLASCNSASLLRAVSTTGGGGGISGNGGVSALKK